MTKTETVAQVVTATTEAGEKEATKVAEVARPSWRRIEAAAGWERLKLEEPDVYRLGVSRRVLGAVWAGVWGETRGAAGLSVEVER